jgi:O-acetyl-ADP-ribose deacetylase (regulator of RNase III)
VIPESSTALKAQEKPKAFVRELYYITHVANLSSILKSGIYCHKLIEEKGITFTPIYNASIVSNRKSITAPDGRSLWNFANVYFQARNPMLYQVVRTKSVEDIAVVGIDKSILNWPDIFITTGNAAHSQSEILPASLGRKNIPSILKEIDVEYWTEANGSKRKIMAEALIPDFIPAHYIKSVYFGDISTKLRTQKDLGNPSNISFMYVPGMFFEPTRCRQITQLLSIVDGDMFFSRAQTLTVSVNTVGIMGKGVASRAKYQFPDVYVQYQDFCRSKKIRMGKPVLYKREISYEAELADVPSQLKNGNGETWFLLFATKKHWRDNADINGIEEGLKWVVENYKIEGIKSLALPALGCGLGNLDWKNVGPLLCKYLSKLNIPVCIYLPGEKQIPDEYLTKEFLLHDSNTTFGNSPLFGKNTTEN